MQAKLVEFICVSQRLDARTMGFYVITETRRAILVPEGIPGGWLVVITGPVRTDFHLMREAVGDEASYIPPREGLPKHLSDFREVGVVEVPEGLVQAAVAIVMDSERVAWVHKAFRELPGLDKI